MAGETILVIDADQAIEQKITTALETKDYLVFTASSQVLNAETLEKLGPSLIYIQPQAPGAAGIEACKAIHGNPILKKVPIVLLESTEGSRDLDNLKVYGIVDLLKLTFGSNELIEKTETILGRRPPSVVHKGNGWVTGGSADDPRPTPHTHAVEGDPQVNEWESIDRALSEKHRRTTVIEPWNKEEGDQGEGLRDEPLWSETVEETGKKRSPFLRPAIGAAMFLVIAGGGLLAYQQFTPTRKVWSVRPVTAPSPFPSKAPGARPEPQASPAKKVADKSAPASQVPESQTPELQASASPVPALAAPALSIPASPVVASPAPSTGLPQAPSLPAGSAPQSPPKPFYSVQIGAFRNEAIAQDLVKAFLEKGYDAFIQSGVTKDKSPIYRVLVSKYEDRKAAKKLAEEIQSKEKIETTLCGD